MRRWLPLAVTAVLLVALLAVVDVQRVVRLFARMSPLFMLLAVTATMVNVLLSSLRYRLILAALGPSAKGLGDIVAINLVTVFAAHFLPVAAAADAVRVALARDKFDLSLRNATESVVADRLIAIVGLCACAIAVLPLQGWLGVPNSLLLSQAIPGVAALGGSAVLVWAVRRGKRAHFQLLERMRAVLSAITQHVSRRELVQGQLALAVLGGLMFALALWAVARSLGTALTLAEAVAFGPAIYIAQVLPFVYFGFGTREAATVILLGGYASLDAESALSVGLGLGLCNLIVALPAPWVAGGMLRRWRRDRG